MKGMGREQGQDPDIFLLLLVLGSHPGGDLSFLLALSSEIPLLERGMPRPGTLTWFCCLL